MKLAEKIAEFLSSLNTQSRQRISSVYQSILKIAKQHPKKTIALMTPFFLLTLAFGALHYYQNSLLYQPHAGFGKENAFNPSGLRHPSERSLDSQDLEIKTKDNVTLKGWHIKKKNSDKLFVVFHGNAGNIGSRLFFVEEFSNHTNSDIIIVGYRGYSDCEGSPSQRGLELDSEAVLATAMKISAERKLPLFIFGRSLGGAVAIYAAGTEEVRAKISGLVVENTFTSISDVVASFHPALSVLLPIIRLININPWKSISRINRVSCPILFIKGMRDRLIPPRMTDQLRQQCEKYHIDNFVYEVERGDHNGTWLVDPDSYFRQINEFIDFYKRI